MKRFVSLFTALTTAAGMMPLTSSAEDPPAETSPSGPIYHYEVTDSAAKTARITGSENISGNVTLPAEIAGCKVTAIADKAFFGNCDITGVTVPDTVEEIGSFAFSGCLNLTDVKLPAGVKKLGNSCFLSCNSLVEADLGYSLTAIPERCFYACPSLLWADIPDTVEMIGKEAYYSCPKVSGLRIPPSVKTIGADAVGVRYNIRTSATESIPGFKLTGRAGSYAQLYSADKGFGFTEEHGEIPGDVDLDGMVLAFDASAVLREYAVISGGGRSTLSRLQRKNADYDHDGRLSASDASDILRAYAVASGKIDY